MKIFYHATHAKYLDSIMGRGLDPKFMNPAWVPDEMEIAQSDKPVYYVFLGNLACAQAWAAHCKFVDPVILEVKPSKKLVKKFIFHLGEFVRVPVLIPPKFIKIEGT